MAEETVAILGLGLMGGSLARDLAGLGHRVLGWDRDPGSVRAALAQGCIHRGRGSRPDDFQGIEEADVVVLALPVAASRETLPALAPRLRASLVTDVGSTKRHIVAAAQSLGLGDQFVGAHPLAGDHRSGWGASRSGLFRGATVFLCPGGSIEGTEPPPDGR
ncbi:MAG: prephenate dehydrogenase/arogenate dehydrogenase family protein, partial [Gemmatimonadetes bacterium]|nr:prephenate dehydrogenase/arogenate dehydrogenase family protein [Gemmatimonadota bacterium]